MKKLYFLLLALLCLSSCTVTPAATEPVFANKAEEAAFRFLESLRDFDTDKAEEMLILKEDEIFFLAMDDDTVGLYTDVCYDTESLDLYFRKAASLMSFQITSSQMEGDKATVKAYVKLVDGSTLLTGAYSGYHDACVSSSLNNEPLPKLGAYIDNYVVKAVHGEAPAMTERIATFSMEQVDGSWKIHSDFSHCPLFTACVFENREGILAAMEKVGIAI